MTIVKRGNPYLPTFSNLFDDIFTRDLFESTWPSSSATGTTIPNVNIYETDNEFKVEMAAP